MVYLCSVIGREVGRMAYTRQVVQVGKSIGQMGRTVPFGLYGLCMSLVEAVMLGTAQAKPMESEIFC